MNGVWTENALSILKQGWLNGDADSKIMADLGGQWSRSAVNGKIHRLKLKGELVARINPSAKPPKPQRAKPEKVASVRVPKLHRNYQPDTPVLEPSPLPPPRIDDSAIPLAQRKQLLDLTPWCCRWPVGEPGTEGFFFCGGVAVEGRPYCAGHARRAYVGVAK